MSKKSNIKNGFIKNGKTYDFNKIYAAVDSDKTFSKRIAVADQNEWREYVRPVSKTAKKTVKVTKKTAKRVKSAPKFNRVKFLALSVLFTAAGCTFVNAVAMSLVS